MYFGGPGPLLSPHDQAGFDEFCINFANEVILSYIIRHTFEDSVGYRSQMTGDGISLAPITTMDNSAFIDASGWRAAQ